MARPMDDVPRVFRVVLEVTGLDAATAFYATLLGTDGRRVSPERHYFDCGPVILAIVDVSSGGLAPRPAPDDLYFAVRDLETVFARATEMGCLSTEDVHGEPGGAIVKRPWGERSFYAVDPFGNGLCFCDEATLFTGR